ncbi:uncharacterized protein LOC129000300 [Macrosteles quadrilineatus]|uniref:uncharacterized protein LOC129000300 n=1 Tax=Macrosteles quadrilineatus TaxID=74068 RepID=UPI0023E2AE9A|nr:uncharacterized protein LOC129000300 [Macrosteles quadrilineatus]
MDTCKVICDTLLNEMMPTPTEDTWRSNAKEFYTRWNFPNCLGSIDGKHVVIQAPPNTGSQYFNYKKSFSVVLLALVDAQYNFVMVDVGAYGKNSDGGIFSSTNFCKAVEREELSIPSSENLPQTTMEVPYVMVGDEAFPLKTYLMRPYPKNDLDDEKYIFNYRLSRARRVVENAFGILCQKFRIFNRRIQAAPENVDFIILTTCILHNFIKKYDKDTHNNERVEDIEVTGSSSISNLPNQGGNARRDAFEVRETFKSYFNSEAGMVPWQ